MSESKLLKSTLDCIEMVNAGIPIERAYSLAKPGRELTRKAKVDMLTKAATYSVTAPKRAKQAARVLDKILKGDYLDKACTIKPNSSAIVKAVEMVIDRTEPKITINQNMNVNVDISPVDLSKYSSRGES